ncbi:glycosyltransferase, partial [Xanthobacter sp. V4C-4]|uniref:glycosyltransferase family 2 protein n=1 Tax=Xanthobacter cornucopiae TaxID=3119924 RepID=UPI00372AE711
MLTAAAFQTGETLLPRRSRERPDVSVLMPLLRPRRSPHLERAVESVLAQRGVAFELVLIDDGSGDDTFSLLQQWHARDPRVTVVRYPRHCGLLGLRLDDGLRHATGRFIGYQLDTVLLRPGALACLYSAAAAASPDTVVVFATGARVPAPEDISPGAPVAGLAGIGIDEPHQLTYESTRPLLLPASLHPRGLVAKIGGFDPRVVLDGVTTRDFWMRARQVGGFQRLDEILVLVIDEPAPGPAISIADLVRGLRDWRALAPQLAPEAVARLDLLDIREPLQAVDRQVLCDGVLRAFIASRCALGEIVGTTVNGLLLAGHHIHLDVVGRADGTPSAKIAFADFARLYPEHIALRFTKRAPVYAWTDPPRALVEFRTF